MCRLTFREVITPDVLNMLSLKEPTNYLCSGNFIDRVLKIINKKLMIKFGYRQEDCSVLDEMKMINRVEKTLCT